MRRIASTVALFLTAIGGATPAHACIVATPLNHDDVRFADVVVIGRITNYRIMLDQQIRRQRRQLLANPDLPPGLRRSYQVQTKFLSDYAHFDVLVDGVLKGRAGRTLTVTWDNSTFGEPSSMPRGPFIVALRKPSSDSPPLRGPSATVMPNREPGSLTVLQAPCSAAFIFESGSADASAIRKILGRR